MRVFELFDHSDIVELDIQVLIHALQSTLDGDIILQFDRDLAIDKRLEETSSCQLPMTLLSLSGSNSRGTHLKNSIAALTLQISIVLALCRTT